MFLIKSEAQKNWQQKLAENFRFYNFSKNMKFM